MSVIAPIKPAEGERQEVTVDESIMKMKHENEELVGYYVALQREDDHPKVTVWGIVGDYAKNLQVGMDEELEEVPIGGEVFETAEVEKPKLKVCRGAFLDFPKPVVLPQTETPVENLLRKQGGVKNLISFWENNHGGISALPTNHKPPLVARLKRTVKTKYKSAEDGTINGSRP